MGTTLLSIYTESSRNKWYSSSTYPEYKNYSLIGIKITQSRMLHEQPCCFHLERQPASAATTRRNLKVPCGRRMINDTPGSDSLQRQTRERKRLRHNNYKLWESESWSCEGWSRERRRGVNGHQFRKISPEAMRYEGSWGLRNCADCLVLTYST